MQLEFVLYKRRIYRSKIFFRLVLLPFPDRVSQTFGTFGHFLVNEVQIDQRVADFAAMGVPIILEHSALPQY